MSSSRLPERSWSLAARLTAWNVASAFLLVFGVTGALYWALVRHLDQEDDAFLTDRVRLLRALWAERSGDSAALKQAINGEGTQRPFGQVGVRFLDEQGQVLLETPGFSGALPTTAFPAPVPFGETTLPGTDIETPGGNIYRVVAARTQVGAEGCILQVAFDRTYEEAVLGRYRRNLWLALAVALVACGVASHQVVRRGLRPLTAITAAARRVHSATLHERLEVHRQPTEVATLAETFNAMLDRLEESFRRLDRFAADIAHELRTPVNNIRGEAEVALGQPRAPAEYRHVLGSCLEECGRLTRLIDSLLFLARAEGRKLPLTTEHVAVGRELEAVRAFYEAAASDAGVTLRVDVGDVVADLDRTLFQRAVANLVANALAHTAAGGVVTLRATTEGDQLRVEVEDSGSGIGPEHLPHVFDRFYRADPARTSASGRVGLGLAIVQSIVELHGGQVSIASRVGQGTRVRLILPVRQAKTKTGH